MKTVFLSLNGCPVVNVEVTGTSTSKFAMLMVDTGASYTSLSHQLLSDIGAELSLEKTIITSAAGIFETSTSHIKSVRLNSLMIENIKVVALTLPESSEIDGVLGVDFFENKKLNIDFKKHTIEVKA